MVFLEFLDVTVFFDLLKLKISETTKNGPNRVPSQTWGDYYIVKIGAIPLPKNM